MTAINATIDVSQDYAAFLRSKATPGTVFNADGTATVPSIAGVNQLVASKVSEYAPHLHEYQRFATAFSVARARSALFMECGLGKTSIAIAWTEHVRGGFPALIVAPLAAQHEFENERAKFFPDTSMQMIATGDLDEWLKDPKGIGLCTHHAFIHRRNLGAISALVLDESSILKGAGGVIAQSLVASARPVPYRLALSATPAPNDPTEYAAHATFLGYMRSDAEFRARFFVRDGKDWRVKGHAVRELPRWLSRFTLWMTDPAAYGMRCDSLPEHDYQTHIIPVPEPNDGVLANRDLFGGVSDSMDMSMRATIMRAAYDDPRRNDLVLDLARGHRTIVWVKRNRHGDALEKMMRDRGVAVAQISGTTDDRDRVRAVTDFINGNIDALISKPSVIGHGVNLQAADRMVFAGYDESYEAMHQAIRRAHRQGRTGTLEVYFPMTQHERRVLAVLDQKRERWDEDSARQQSEFVDALTADIAAFRSDKEMSTFTDTAERLPDIESDHFRLINGDCVDVMRDMERDSVDMAVFSPPFASLFTYSSDIADMGNCSEHGDAEFGIHFTHFARELLGVLKPGRVVALHLAQLVAFKTRHGRKGIRDFRGATIQLMEDAGFHFYGEFVIPKNPQAVAIRTKSERLQFSQFKRDSLESSPALNDYVLEFRKPGKQSVPVLNDVTNDEWINWASGVWTDISETDVLQHRGARTEEDEKHICPLQLTVIERCIRLWTNPGEVVLSPFAGIGSEIHQAIRLRRFGLGIELKPEYFKQAGEHCRVAEHNTYSQLSLLEAAQ